VAELQGCERGTLGSSTLHLFWDVFGLITQRPCIVFEDAGVYPIARWGVERAAGRGTVVHRIAHYDADALRRWMHETQGRPIMVVCGFCPGCGRHAPIPEYLDAMRERHGLLVIDDTQALGIFGQQTRANAPFGSGGGGSLQWFGVRDPSIILISSLAKGFGVPLAVMAGSRQAVEQFERESETRVHCSPPSVANVHAAEHALDVNQSSGDALRLRLAWIVHHFHIRLRHFGLNTTGGIFPAQTLRGIAGDEAVQLHARLQQRSIHTVLHQGQHIHTAGLTIILNARHRAEAINRLTRALVEEIHDDLYPAKRW
jgi:8-amino-7-oxononanoate synthase